MNAETMFLVVGDYKGDLCPWFEQLGTWSLKSSNFTQKTCRKQQIDCFGDKAVVLIRRSRKGPSLFDWKVAQSDLRMYSQHTVSLLFEHDAAIRIFNMPALIAFVFAIFLMIGALVHAQTVSNQNNNAQQAVEAFHQTLISVMKDGPNLGFQGRVAILAPAVETFFKIPLMTRMSVGPLWNSFTSAQQTHLIEAFSRFSVANYAASFKEFDSERFSTEGVRPGPNGVGIIVETILHPKKDAPVALNYLLRDNDGRFRTIDVFLSGTISELASRRSEFSAVTRDGGADALISLLEKKVSELSQK
ncbi:phospholipid transport system substrate-binding protein [Azospirillaceae bacterium]